MYISFKEVAELNVPRFQYTCATIALGPVDFPPPPSPAAPPPPTFDEIYTMYIRAGYTFAQPLFNDNGELLRLLFVAPLCADCSLSGSLTKPDFWVDQ